MSNAVIITIIVCVMLIVLVIVSNCKRRVGYNPYADEKPPNRPMPGGQQPEDEHK